MAVRGTKFHKLDQSRLFKVQSPRALAKLLFLSVDGLQSFTKNEASYSVWPTPKKNGGERIIEAPHDNLKKVQKRIADLLYKIETPDYVIAPAKNKSYVQNAAMHRGARQFHLLDIEDFFPSCTSRKVFWFFNSIMKCPRDVSAILTSITTYKGHLPQGSPSSPILAFYSYLDMWSGINSIATEAGCKLSIYADDITVSGQSFSLNAIWKIKSILRKCGHTHSRSKERGFIDKPADITGVILDGHKVKLPNRQHLKLKKAKDIFTNSNNHHEKEAMMRQIVGRLAQKRQIESY
jgi:retron-type reverse transcriptase